MNLIIRNLLHVIRRFKLATSLNILGLSVAFAAFMVIMMQLDYNFGFDRFHKNSDKIFRYEIRGIFGMDNAYKPIIARPFSELIFKSSPHIVASTIILPMGGEIFFRVENSGNYFKEGAINVTPEFTEVFSFDFVEGYENALSIPDNVIIPLSLSQKLFGNESAVGQQLTFIVGEIRQAQIGAVYRDFPRNSIINNYIYSAIPEDENRQNWGAWDYVAYVRLDNAANVPTVIESFKQTFESIFGQSFDLDDPAFNIRLTALPDIHFATDVFFDNAPKASKQTLMILLAIAIAIVVIAGINFTNFSTALMPMRARKINTQRVLGAQQRTVRLVLVFEAIAFCLLSYLLALGFVWLFGNSPLASLTDADLLLSAQRQIVVGTALVALLVGLLAGLYPARKMTSFVPALALKGNFGLSPKGKKLRNVLIGIQYIASFTLIIGTSFMFLQNHFMQNAPLGYDQDKIITVGIRQQQIQEQRDVLANKLKTHSTIADVTFGEILLGGFDFVTTWGGQPYKDGEISFQVAPVDYNFLSVLGIEVVEGRDFRREDTSVLRGALIFNETARREFDLELNTRVADREIIGFIPDIKLTSLRLAIAPMAFYVRGTENWGRQPNVVYVRVVQGANLREARKHIQSTLAEFDPNFPFEIRFYDQILQELYEKERALSSLILLFSLIAIFISIVGVFGLVVFDSECRRKEIGIRKVLGASTFGIIVMFNKAYSKILLICFVAAVPLAWYAVSRWLENFAYRTPMYWWVYLLAFLAVSAITVLTVTIQNWRVANDNPVKSIKTE